MDDKNQSGSDGNPDLCWTDHEAQSDPTGSPPRCEKDDRKDKDNDRKSRLFRSNQLPKKKHSISNALDKSCDSTSSAADNSVVS